MAPVTSMAVEADTLGDMRSVIRVMSGALLVCTTCRVINVDCSVVKITPVLPAYEEEARGSSASVVSMSTTADVSVVSAVVS